MNSMMAKGFGALIASNHKATEGRTMIKLIVSVLGIAMIVAAKAVIVEAGDNSPKLIHTESVGQITTGAPTFGRVGPNCNASTGGSACAYVSEDATDSANTVPFGPSTRKVKEKR